MRTSDIDPDDPIRSMMQHFYSTIDAQHWEEQETFISDNFVALLGSSIQLSFKTWQERLKEFYKGFPDGRHVLDFYMVEGDRILSVGRFVGSHKNEFMGEPATGNQIEMGVMHLDRVVGNKIVEHIAAADLLGLLRQIKNG